MLIKVIKKLELFSMSIIKVILIRLLIFSTISKLIIISWMLWKNWGMLDRGNKLGKLFRLVCSLNVLILIVLLMCILLLGIASLIYGRLPVLYPGLRIPLLRGLVKLDSWQSNLIASLQITKIWPRLCHCRANWGQAMTKFKPICLDVLSSEITK